MNVCTPRRRILDRPCMYMVAKNLVDGFMKNASRIIAKPFFFFFFITIFFYFLVTAGTVLRKVRARWEKL